MMMKLRNQSFNQDEAVFELFFVIKFLEVFIEHLVNLFQSILILNEFS